jgi:hypothetical protein
MDLRPALQPAPSTERLGWNRPIPLPVRPWSARLGEPLCADATSLVDWFTNTNELHERIYAPYGSAETTQYRVTRCELPAHRP